MNTINLNKILLQQIEINQYNIDVLRLDLIHPIISGNKWFKLKYYIEEFNNQDKNIIATFGGAYSNHIVATAYTCKELHINSVGFIRGEKPTILSHTLENAIKYGMKLHFLSRDEYKKKEKIIENHNPFYFIPEGGFGELGTKGSSEILDLVSKNTYSHILCSVGTGTMIAGIINSSTNKQNVIGINILKGNTSINSEINSLIIENKKYTILNDYHFGGYAKKTDDLLHFMNNFCNKHKIPTDFVYSGKLMYALQDLCFKKYFSPTDKILAIHCGGLQGNVSLPKNSLSF